VRTVALVRLRMGDRSAVHRIGTLDLWPLPLIKRIGVEPFRATEVAEEIIAF
jgi:hypothetical protein